MPRAFCDRLFGWFNAYVERAKENKQNIHSLDDLERVLKDGNAAQASSRSQLSTHLCHPRQRQPSAARSQAPATNRPCHHKNLLLVWQTGCKDKANCSRCPLVQPCIQYSTSVCRAQGLLYLKPWHALQSGVADSGEVVDLTGTQTQSHCTCTRTLPFLEGMTSRSRSYPERKVENTMLYPPWTTRLKSMKLPYREGDRGTKYASRLGLRKLLRSLPPPALRPRLTHLQ